ncbi:hypothetical protein V1264_007366 [Littorina saxatilis]|uniref:OTU domain-containing protein n=1 Tax=Littorina saxatilis TaxID=31220 RepID=A0AAN9G358_9CAEN
MDQDDWSDWSDWPDWPESVAASVDSDSVLLGSPQSQNEDTISESAAGDGELEAALSASRNNETLYQLAIRLHNKRLDGRLHANAMTREPVYADGNCFFKAASLHVTTHDDSALRQALCDHILENLTHYEGFFLESTETARNAVTALRSHGVWDNCANDVMPLALSNFTKRRVKIFISRTSAAVINITPTLPGCQGDAFNPIYLALLTPPGVPQHYDGCLAARRSVYTVFGTTTSSHQDNHTSTTEMEECHDEHVAQPPSEQGDDGHVQTPPRCQTPEPTSTDPNDDQNNLPVYNTPQKKLGKKE